MSEVVQSGGSNEPMLATFGDVSVSQHWVHVPSGRQPIRGSAWTVQDMTRVEEKISTVGIVLAVIGFLMICVFSLLFLLMKDTRQVGWVQVTVQGQGFHHSTMVPASPAAVPQAHQFVNYCRSLSAA